MTLARATCWVNHRQQVINANDTLSCPHFLVFVKLNQNNHKYRQVSDPKQLVGSSVSKLCQQCSVLPIFSSSQITLPPTTRTRSPSFAGRKRRRSGKQSVVCNIGSAVAFNWFLFAITGLQQLQEIGIGCISAADNFESPTRLIIFSKAHRLNISEM